MSARLSWITENAEWVMEYNARHSAPKNQSRMEDGELSPGQLLRYCLNHKHFSVFEMANACLILNTTRDISAQIIRHRSFTFQEFSQRYASVPKLTQPEMRMQATDNRQSSTDVTEQGNIVEGALATAEVAYHMLLDRGVARETARRILPMCSPTTISMNGTIRSWIHYIELRTKPDTQKEHRDLALQCRSILSHHLPVLANELGWNED